MVGTAVSWEDTLAGWSPEIQPRTSLLSTPHPQTLNVILKAKDPNVIDCNR